MESSIRIDFVDDGAGIQPVIIVKMANTNDARDKLLRTLFQAPGNALSIEYVNPLHEYEPGKANTEVILRKVFARDID